MRVQNSLQNMFFGLAGQIISALMGFIVRTVFIYTLGVEYLGVEGLFTSIFIMLSMANLGFDTAIIYSLYKPLAEKNVNKIQALMNLYKKAYRLVGIVILLVGVSLFPFLPFLINGETNIKNINIIYLLFLINSVSSYFLVYAQSILIADQNSHIISKIHSVFIIISNIIQIILLITTKNFIVVLIAQIFFRISENIYISYIAKKTYPYLNKNKSAKLSKNDNKIFFKDLYALMLYKISGVVINGTDNLVISKFVGITWVGIYSNYFLIISTLNSFLSHLFYSINASVGNLNVTETPDKKYFVFRVINFANFWIFGVCTVCLWNLLNPFITIWLGEEYILNKYVVFSILLNFYTTGMQNASTTFRETTGLFKKGKYRPIVAALINIVVSILLAEKFGIAGVFFGTIISRICTFFWYDPYIIYKNVFRRPVSAYFLKYIFYAILVSVSVLITNFIGNLMNFNITINLGVKTLLSFLIPNLIFIAIFRKSEEFKYLVEIGRMIFNKLPIRTISSSSNYN